MKLRCGLTLPNRRALAPLTNTQSHPDGTLGDDEQRWLLRRAEGGFGLISTCAAFVHPEGNAWRGQLGIASDLHDAGLARLAASLGERGVPAIVQLHHGGKKADMAPRKISASASEGVEAASEADLDAVIAMYVQAAQRAEKAGFQGVEIHGANGYLFTQFLAPADNQRTDGWGGSLANRARLLRETTRVVREAVSAGFAVGVRISPVDTWDRRGLVLDDGVQVARWLADDGVDFVHLSLRDASGPPPLEPDRGPVARAVRDVLPAEVALLAAGGIRTRADELRAHAAGVDVVVIGRAAIRHADWARRVDEPGFEPAPTPWSRADLTDQAVGPGLLDYLARMPGLVEGGAPGR